MHFYEKGTKLFSFWVNTAFSTGDQIEIPKEGLDKAHKDRSCKVFKKNFKVIASIQPLDIGSTNGNVHKMKSSSDTSLVPFEDDDDDDDDDEEEDDGEVLNVGAPSNSKQQKRQANEVAEDLLKAMIELHINQCNTGIIDSNDLLSEMQSSAEFQHFTTASCDLQKVSVATLSHEEKLAFWVNVYNTLAMHSNVVF
jgi:hypothetical protein